MAESAGLFAQSQGAWFLHLCVHTFQAQGSTHGRSSTVEEWLSALDSFCNDSQWSLPSWPPCPFCNPLPLSCAGPSDLLLTNRIQHRRPLLWLSERELWLPSYFSLSLTGILSGWNSLWLEFSLALLLATCYSTFCGEVDMAGSWHRPPANNSQWTEPSVKQTAGIKSYQQW